MSPGLRAGHIIKTVSCGDGELMNVETTSDVMQTIELNIQYGGVEWRQLLDRDVSSDTIMLKLGYSSLGTNLLKQ